MNIDNYLFPLILNISKYFLVAGIPFLIFYLLFPRTFKVNKIQSRNAKKKDFYREIGHSLQATLVFVGVIMLILKTPLREYTQFYTNATDYPLWWIPLSVFIALIIHDTYFYWMHKTVHHPKLYRRVHFVHHKSTNPSPWTSFSFHFFESLLESLVGPLILFLIPVHPIALIAFGFVSFGFNVYGHLGFEIAPKWFRHSLLFEIMNTSTHHNMHHSRFKGNYGLYFRIWDRLMGTEHPEYVVEYDKIQERRFGSSVPSNRGDRITILRWFIPIIACTAITAFSYTVSDGIEGKWKFKDNGAVVRIYEENGFYFGELIEAGNGEDDKKLKNHGEIILLKNFEKKSETEFCCGTLFAPKKNKTLDASMTLENRQTLRIDATYGVFSGSRKLERVSE
jgi:sterol desaturase/sphingolipid hydroxylase (fatty acid hydroxylase superfamily)